jgi:hypothetical protein
VPVALVAALVAVARVACPYGRVVVALVAALVAVARVVAALVAGDAALPLVAALVARVAALVAALVAAPAPLPPLLRAKELLVVLAYAGLCSQMLLLPASDADAC